MKRGTVAVLVDHLDDYDRKVLDTFLEGDRLKTIPAKQKKREVVLRYLAEQFEPNRMYDEREVNAVLAQYHVDVASLRRYLVDTNLLQRQIVRTVQAAALLQGEPEIEYHNMYWKPDPSREAYDGERVEP